jgi:hypothetical protein
MLGIGTEFYPRREGMSKYMDRSKLRLGLLGGGAGVLVQSHAPRSLAFAEEDNLYREIIPRCSR